MNISVKLVQKVIFSEQGNEHRHSQVNGEII